MTTGRKSDSLYDMPAEPIANTVGLNIRAEMGRQKMSLKKLSETIGVPRSSLAHQIDISRVTVDNLVLIARALKVEVSELLPDDVEVAS